MRLAAGREGRVNRVSWAVFCVVIAPASSRSLARMLILTRSAPVTGCVGEAGDAQLLGIRPLYPRECQRGHGARGGETVRRGARGRRLIWAPAALKCGASPFKEGGSTREVIWPVRQNRQYSGLETLQTGRISCDGGLISCDTIRQNHVFQWLRVFHRHFQPFDPMPLKHSDLY